MCLYSIKLTNIVILIKCVAGLNAAMRLSQFVAVFLLGDIALLLYTLSILKSSHFFKWKKSETKLKSWSGHGDENVSARLNSKISLNWTLNTERAYIWSLRVSTCQSLLFSKHFIGWKTMKFVRRQRGSSLLLRQRKAILCCCETTFFKIIAELTCSLTYQIIISPIPSIPDFVYTHSLKTILWTVNACLHSMFLLDLQSLWQSTHAWAYVEKPAKYFKRRTHYNSFHLDIYLKPWLLYGF